MPRKTTMSMVSLPSHTVSNNRDTVNSPQKHTNNLSMAPIAPSLQSHDDDESIQIEGS